MDISSLKDLLYAHVINTDFTGEDPNVLENLLSQLLVNTQIILIFNHSIICKHNVCSLMYKSPLNLREKVFILFSDFSVLQLNPKIVINYPKRVRLSN